MIVSLIALYRKVGVWRYLHLTEFQKSQHGGYSGGGNFSLLAYWNFILPGERVGFWSVTYAGEDFLLGRTRVLSAVKIYNDTFLGFKEDSPLVGVEDVLGRKFDYRGLMG